MIQTNTTAHMSTPLRAFYGTVLTLAMVGQFTAAQRWIKMPAGVPDAATLLITGGFVAVLELGAVALLQEVVRRRGRGQSAWVPLTASVAVVAVATFITVVGHWGASLSDQISSVAFGLVTVLGYLVWLITSDLSERPEHVRRRRVRAAVTVYVKSLPGLSPEEKGVLLASQDSEDIASRITAGLDNERIAAILSHAIAPSRWDMPGNNDVPVSRPVKAPRPSRRGDIPQPVTGVDVPTPVRVPAVPRPPHPMAETEPVPSPHGVPGKAPADPIPAAPVVIDPVPQVRSSTPKPAKPLAASDRDGAIVDALRALESGTSEWSSQAAIAKQFGISTSQLSRIKQRALTKVNGS